MKIINLNQEKLEMDKLVSMARYIKGQSQGSESNLHYALAPLPHPDFFVLAVTSSHLKSQTIDIFHK